VGDLLLDSAGSSVGFGGGSGRKIEIGGMRGDIEIADMLAVCAWYTRSGLKDGNEKTCCRCQLAFHQGRKCHTMFPL
jgi:hypothetical protein